MKRFVILLLCYAVALVGAMLIAGCQSSPPLDPLIRAIESALADGVVTAAEQAEIQSYMPRRFDWGPAVAIGTSILGSILGIKILPGSALRGPWDRPQPPQPS